MSAGSVFVAGSLHYDILIESPRLPARDETLMGGPMRFACGGKGGNQAVAAARHGVETAFGGAVGADRFGDTLLAHLSEAGVDVTQVARIEDAQSGASVAILEETGDYGAVVATGANRLIQPDAIALPEGVGWLVLQNEIPEPVNLSLAEKAKAVGARVALNAAPWRTMSADQYALTDLLIVNRVEAGGLFGAPVEPPSDAARLLEHAPEGPDAVIVTLGADGLVYRDRDAAPRTLAAWDVAALSAHGAGDWFVGALVSALSRGDSLNRAADYAAAAAALYVTTEPEERLTLDEARTRAFMASAHRRASSPPV